MTESRKHLLGIVGVVCVGISVSVQATINGALGVALDDGIAAATISFGLGLILLSIGMVFDARIRAGVATIRAAVRDGALSPTQCLGGVCGAYYIACQGLTIGLVGVAVFTVAVVGGQLASSMWVDRAGIGPGGPTPITRNRMIGGALAVGAVALATSGRFGEGLDAIGWAVLPALAGVGLAWQQAVNGRVAVAGTPIAATWLNFAVGTTALLVVVTVHSAVVGWPQTIPTDAWLYLGGALGVVHIAATTVIVRWIGVLLVGLGAIAGQLIGAVALDAFVPAASGLSATVVFGAVLTLVAVAVAARGTS